MTCPDSSVINPLEIFQGKLGNVSVTISSLSRDSCWDLAENIWFSKTKQETPVQMVE